METIKVDFIEIEHHLWKGVIRKRVQFEEKYNVALLPQRGNYIVIGSNLYKVEQLTYFPFGDSEGQIGVIVYISKK